MLVIRSDFHTGTNYNINWLIHKNFGWQIFKKKIIIYDIEVVHVETNWTNFWKFILRKKNLVKGFKQFPM